MWRTRLRPSANWRPKVTMKTMMRYLMHLSQLTKIRRKHVLTTVSVTAICTKPLARRTLPRVRGLAVCEGSK
jgi:hypothetical protein